MRFPCLRLLGPGDQEKLYQANDAIEQFTEGTSQTDDITFLLVQSNSQQN